MFLISFIWFTYFNEKNNNKVTSFIVKISLLFIFRNDLVVSDPIDKIKHGDVIQLIHGMTSRALNRWVVFDLILS